ncbi:hypothetical protein MT325_m650L [Paramecium bursaria chlorella virus MT325]|uniref:Uncharacterized protein m650L n=1 Tax=Paramecium bursaria Chlorella virus MT325 TaxID=346932 RepID=A7IV30_PBCVM|nr:hypothetical protein MT325_m650L [Paramecium bursaria chlorella virus MT325]
MFLFAITMYTMYFSVRSLVVLNSTSKGSSLVFLVVFMGSYPESMSAVNCGNRGNGISCSNLGNFFRSPVL